MELDLEKWLEILDDRVVQTSKGPYISVGDLKKLNEEFKEAKKGAEPDKAPTGKTLNQVSRELIKDPEFLKQFDDTPKAPADAGVVKPVTGREELSHEAA